MNSEEWPRISLLLSLLLRQVLSTTIARPFIDAGSRIESLPNGVECSHNLDCASGCCMVNTAGGYWESSLPVGICVAEALVGQVCGLLNRKKSQWNQWGVPGTYRRNYYRDFFPDTSYDTTGGYNNNNHGMGMDMMGGNGGMGMDMMGGMGMGMGWIVKRTVITEKED